MKFLYSGVLSLLLSACSAGQNANVSVKKILQDGEYKIEKIINKTNNETYTATTDWAFRLDNNMFGLYVGCNRIFGGVESDGALLTYKQAASTKMMCNDEVMKVEDFVIQNLTTMNSIENGLENDKIKIVFKEQ